MQYLGSFQAGDTVKYRGNFHNDTGTLEDPTGPEAQLEVPAGTFSALTAPAKVNAKDGHFGGDIDTTGFANGQYIIRMAGTVATGKIVATECYFQIASASGGSGNTAIDHNTGGVDNLQALYGGVGVDNADIKIYLKADWDLGNQDDSYVKGVSVTSVDGRWAYPVYLDSGFTYTVVFYKQGLFQATTAEVTI